MWLYQNSMSLNQCSCYKVKNCPSNVTAILQVRCYLYSNLQFEFFQFSFKQATIKGNLKPKNSALFLWHNFNDFIENKPGIKIFERFNQFSQSYEVAKFWTRREWFHTRQYTKYFTPAFLCTFLLFLW